MSTFERSRPSLEVGDLGAALALLTEVVGFTAHVVEGEPPLFAIVGDRAAEIAPVEVDEPAITHGAACSVPLTERPWGQRDVVGRVPGDGPLLAFGETIEPEGSRR